MGYADVGKEEEKENGDGNGLSLPFLCSKKLVCVHCIVSQNAALCNTGSPYLSDFTGSDHWVAALSQCFYLTAQKLEKKN